LGSIPEGFAGAAAGVAVIGFLNFTVSFALAYLVAARACGVSYQDRRRVFRALLRDLVRSPGRFLLPPRGAAVSQ
jgi:site-specific recombinase